MTNFNLVGRTYVNTCVANETLYVRSAEDGMFTITFTLDGKTRTTWLTFAMFEMCIETGSYIDITPEWSSSMSPADFSKFYTQMQDIIHLGNKFSLQELAYEIKCYINGVAYEGQLRQDLSSYRSALCELLDECRRAFVTAPVCTF